MPSLSFSSLLASLHFHAAKPQPVPAATIAEGRTAIRAWLRNERLRYDYSRVDHQVKFVTRFHWLLLGMRKQALALADACITQNIEKHSYDQRIREQVLEEISTQPEVLTVALYAPVNGEVDLLPMAARLVQQGITVCLPAMQADSRELVFRQYKPGDRLVRHRYGMDEPNADSTICIPDVICAPLVAFDAAGHRLGYGGGFYDTTLARMQERGHSPSTIGIAYVFQELADIFPEPHDVALSLIITPTHLLRPAKSVI
jgi:5-formyltetrahydrofolate cyclo-ligase